MRFKYVFLVVAIGIFVVSLALVIKPESTSPETTQASSSVHFTAPAAKPAPEMKVDKSVAVRELKVSDGHTYVTFSNGMKAVVSGNVQGRELLQVGLNVNVSYVETDGLPEIQVVSAAITPPGCIC